MNLLRAVTFPYSSLTPSQLHDQAWISLWLGMGCKSSERLWCAVDFSVISGNEHALQLAAWMLWEKKEQAKFLLDSR